MKAHQHETRTYRGRPACAGSAVELVNGACSVCGRTHLGTIDGGAPDRVRTHIHTNDLARNTRVRHAAPVVREIPVPETFTDEQDAAIRAFHAERSDATYLAMQNTGATTKNYTLYARENGIS